MSKNPEILDRREKEILQIILDRQINGPTTLNVSKTRLEFMDDRTVLDQLTNMQLLKRDSSQTNYELSLVGLYLADSDLSARIFDDIDRICYCLRDSFKQEINARIDDIRKTTEFDKRYLVWCVNWLSDGIAIGRTSDLMSEDASITPTEALFDFEHFTEIAEKYFRYWFTSDSKAKPNTHGNTENNSQKREAVLRAIIYALVNFNDECRSKEGKIMGSKIANVLDQKSPLLFRQYGGEPPFTKDKIARMANECLKLPE
jgi:hypothetical protein